MSISTSDGREIIENRITLIRVPLMSILSCDAGPPVPLGSPFLAHLPLNEYKPTTKTLGIRTSRGGNFFRVSTLETSGEDDDSNEADKEDPTSDWDLHKLILWKPENSENEENWVIVDPRLSKVKKYFLKKNSR